MPGKKYSSLAGQPAQASWPVRVQMVALTKSAGGEKVCIGWSLRMVSKIKRQMGEAPVIPEAT